MSKSPNRSLPPRQSNTMHPCTSCATTQPGAAEQVSLLRFLSWAIPIRWCPVLDLSHHVACAAREGATSVGAAEINNDTTAFVLLQHNQSTFSSLLLNLNQLSRRYLSCYTPISKCKIKHNILSRYQNIVLFYRRRGKYSFPRIRLKKIAAMLLHTHREFNVSAIIHTGASGQVIETLFVSRHPLAEIKIIILKRNIFLLPNKDTTELQT